MKLHENKTLFRQAVQITADRMGIATVYVEKDYWVTYALSIIFNHDVGRDVIFKGGTALSKCFRMIERFSEDIDLVVLKREGETSNQLKTKLRLISTILGKVLPETRIDGITRKKGMNRKTAHDYDKNFAGDFGQIRNFIVLESSWLGNHEPYSTRNIISYVGQMMLDTAQVDMAKDNGLLSFGVLVLEPTRTICEKIMSLVRFSYGEHPIDDLRNKVRHIYDLHQLLKQDDLLEFFHSGGFDEMLLKVGKDDVEGFRNNNKWLAYHPSKAFFFEKLDTIWTEIKDVYSGEFRNLVYGELPKEKDVFDTLKMIQERLKTVQWTIKLDPES